MMVYVTYADHEGSLWIGTANGLTRWKEGRFTTYTAKEGLSAEVFQIFEDAKRNLWLGTYKGIIRVRKQELDDLAQNKIRSITPVAFGRVDGMKSSECNGAFQSAGWKTRAGKLWFPTMKGLVMVDPDQKTNTVAPPVLIEQILIDKRWIHPRGKTVCPPGQGELEFHYTGLSFMAPEKVKFRYKLEGFDKEWVDADTRRTAFYTNIPPGHYRFQVIACNNDGVWNETGAAFNVELAPHFYQTTY